MAKAIQALREQRAAYAKEARNILDTKTGKDWTKETAAQVDDLYAKIDDLDGQIERFERALTLEDSLDQRGQQRAERSGLSTDEEASNVATEKAIFDAWCRGGLDQLSDEQREYVASRRAEARRLYGAQSVGTGSQGGYLVPRDFAATLLEKMAAYGGVRSVANVIQTDGGNSIDFPTVDETGQEGELVGENTAAAAQDIVFGTTAIDAFKYSSKIVAVPIELIQDSRIDIEAYVNKALAERIARITNRHFTVGDGNSKPRGLVAAATLGKTGVVGQTTSVTYDDLVDLEHSVDPAYRNDAGWMFHDQTLKVIKKLKDGQGRPLWRPGVTGGDPNDILGYSYTVNQHMATMAASARSIAFGDMSKYTIRDVMAVTLFRFADSKYMEKGQVGFLAWSRHDGDLIDATTEAVRYYANSAT